MLESAQIAKPCQGSGWAERVSGCRVSRDVRQLRARGLFMVILQKPIA